MVEGKTLTTFRDIIVIIGVVLLCFLQMQALTVRLEARREEQARFAVARGAIARLDEAYKQLVANKPINEQIFRQNEVLIEYQKLLLTIAYMPVPVTTAKPAAPASQPPAKR